MCPTKMNKGLTIFGLFVFAIGLFCVFWRGEYFRNINYIWGWEYPFRELGIILTVAGVLLTAIGLVLPRKT